MRPRILIGVGVVALAVLAAGTAFGAAGPGSAPAKSGAPPTELRQVRPGDDLEFVPGQVVVRFRAGVANAERVQVLRTAEVTLERGLGLPRLVLAEIDDGASPVAAARELERLPEVLYAEPNFIVRGGATIPDDPRFGELWGLHQASDADIDAPEAWDLTTGSANVTVAIVDSGIALGHPDLAPNIWTNAGETGGGKETNGVDDDGNGFVDDWRGWDWIDGDNLPLDELNHGTHVAGTAGARGNDATGVAGVNWSARLMALRILNADNAGSAADFAAAFAYACAKGADVVNASLGVQFFSNAMRDAILACPNTLFVVIAHNHGSNLDTSPIYPCLYHRPAPVGVNAQNVICVAATNSADELWASSNYSATGVHLAAPGVGILSTVPAQERLVFDQFEDAASLPGTWMTSGTAPWTRTTEASVSPAFSITDSAGGPYAANADALVARASAVSLDGKDGCDLTYRLRLETESDYDFLSIEHSTSAGGPWTRMANWHGSSSGSFLAESAPLTALEGAPAAHIAFRLTSDDSYQYDGAHLDNVAIRCLTDTFGPNNYGLFDGTSMAAPHVAGAAALLLALDPSLTVAKLNAALLGGVEPLASLSGKTVTGGRLNVRNSLNLVASAPGAPTGVSAVGGDGQATVSWTAPASDGGSAITNYVVTPYIGSNPQTSTTVGNVTQTIVTGLTNGTSYTFKVRARNAVGDSADSAASNPVTAQAPAGIAIADFDGDGDTDFSVWRPVGGTWYAFGGLSQQWGVSDDVPVPGQYDGDPATDVAVWRPTTGTWYVHGGATQQWGVSSDVPVPGDYDGDGDTEFAVWRPVGGTWYVQGGATQQWGVSTDIPVPGDYDGDGDTDFAVWRPATGTWYVQGGLTQQWGVSSDVPVPGQYDADPATEIAVWRPSTGTWYVHGGAAQQWGVSTDVPVQGDYDGDGDTEFAVWRPASGSWFVHGGATQQWGVSSDKPLPVPPAIARLLFR